MNVTSRKAVLLCVLIFSTFAAYNYATNDARNNPQSASSLRLASGEAKNRSGASPSADDSAAGKNTEDMNNEKSEIIDKTDTATPQPTESVTTPKTPTDQQPAPKTQAQATESKQKAPAPAPKTPEPAVSVASSGYSTNAATRQLLSRMGLSEQGLWNMNIKIIPYDGLVPKRCALGSLGKYVSGMAVRSDVKYTTCPDGGEVIYPHYRTAGKCTVVYDWTKHYLGHLQSGNSYSVLAHEIGHCLHFNSRSGLTGFNQKYATQVRPELTGKSYVQSQEVIGDDFMICRMSGNTNWSYGYYSRYGVNPPSPGTCAKANALFRSEFGV